jgi:hypothetical protein
MVPRMKRILLAALLGAVLAGAGRANDAVDGHAAEIMQRLALEDFLAFALRVSMREGAVGGGAKENELGCLDSIKPEDFTEALVRSIEHNFDVQQRAEVVAFLKTAAGEKFSMRTRSKFNDAPMPEVSAEEKAEIEKFEASAAGKKIIDGGTMIGNPIVTKRIGEVVAAITTVCKAAG